MVIYEGKTTLSVVGLTFDDGPNPKITPRILEILKDKGVKATFFLIGARAEEFPDVVQQIIKEGHEIGNHGYLHKPMAVLLKEKGKQAVIEEVQKSRDVLAKLAGVSNKDIKFFRPPTLDWSLDVEKIIGTLYGNNIVAAHSYTSDWSWDSSYTWDENDSGVINDKAKVITGFWGASAKNGSIIALHDSAEYGLPTHPDHPNWRNRALPTLMALPKVIDDVLSKGLIIKKLSEMDLVAEAFKQ